MPASVARIYVNDIEVGTLPADQYEYIVKQVKAEKRLYLEWLYGMLKLILRPVLRYISWIPGIIAGMFLVMAVLQPAELALIIDEIRAADSKAIVEGLRMLVTFTIPVGICYGSARVFFVGPHTLPDPFGDEISRWIRSELEVPTEGRMTVELVPHDARA